MGRLGNPWFFLHLQIAFFFFLLLPRVRSVVLSLCMNSVLAFFLLPNLYRYKLRVVYCNVGQRVLKGLSRVLSCTSRVLATYSFAALAKVVSQRVKPCSLMHKLASCFFFCCPEYSAQSSSKWVGPKKVGAVLYRGQYFHFRQWPDKLDALTPLGLQRGKSWSTSSYTTITALSTTSSPSCRGCTTRVPHGDACTAARCFWWLLKIIITSLFGSLYMVLRRV